MQKHWMMCSDNAGEQCTKSWKTCHPDFGFPGIAVHAHEPETIYVVPIKSDSEQFHPMKAASTAAERAETSGEALTNGRQSNCYVTAARRDGSDRCMLDSCHLLRKAPAAAGVCVGRCGVT